MSDEEEEEGREERGSKSKGSSGPVEQESGSFNVIGYSWKDDPGSSEIYSLCLVNTLVNTDPIQDY